MSAVQPFTFPATGQPVRTILIDGEPWFVAADVARTLGYRMASDMTRRLDDDEKGTHSARTPGGEQDMAVITESGLYAAVLGSQIPAAREFKRWVTRDVLPALRRTGIYAVPAQAPAEVSRRDMALMILAAEEAREAEAERADRAELAAAELLPAAHAWDTLATAAGDYAVADAAKILSRDPNIKTGRDRLFTFMGKQRWIYRNGDGHWCAYQAAIDCGRLMILPSSHYHPRTGELVLDPAQIRITVKGVLALHKLLGGEGAGAVDVQHTQIGEAA